MSFTVQARLKELQSEVFALQRDIRRLKVESVVCWVGHLMTPPHRCLISIAAQHHYSTKIPTPLPIADLEKYKNGLNLIRDLEKGLVIKMVQQEKKPIAVKINEKFFTIVQSLIQRMRTKISKQMPDKQKRIQLGYSYLQCQKCGRLVSNEELEFRSGDCQCGNSTFNQFNPDNPKYDFYEKILMMAQNVLKQISLIEELQQKLTKKLKEITAVQNTPQSVYDLFMRQHKLNQVKAKNIPEYKFRNDYSDFIDKISCRRFKKLQELHLAKSHRKQRFAKLFEDKGMNVQTQVKKQQVSFPQLKQSFNISHHQESTNLRSILFNARSLSFGRRQTSPQTTPCKRTHQKHSFDDSPATLMSPADFSTQTALKETKNRQIKEMKSLSLKVFTKTKYDLKEGMVRPKQQPFQSSVQQGQLL